MKQADNFDLKKFITEGTLSKENLNEEKTVFLPAQVGIDYYTKQLELYNQLLANRKEHDNDIWDKYKVWSSYTMSGLSKDARNLKWHLESIKKGQNQHYDNYNLKYGPRTFGFPKPIKDEPGE